MQVNKQYAGGGFFGNSQAKFADMEGAGSGINMAFANRNRILPGNLRKLNALHYLSGGDQGRALRQEKRYLKKLERQGKLNEYGTQSQDRLDYLRNVQKDRAKKGIAAGALAAGAAFGLPAAGGAIAAKGGLGAVLKGAGAKLGAKGGAKSLLTKFQKGKKAFDTVKGFADGITPEQDEQVMSGDFYGDPSMNPYYKGGKIRVLKGEGGLRVPEGADVASLLASLDNFTEEKEKRRRAEKTQIAPPLSDEQMTLKVLAALLERYKDSTPSIMGPKATDRYYSRR